MAELTHHGVKGMRWGVRRTPAQLEAAAEARKKVQVKATPGKRVKTKGGRGNEATDDAIQTAVSKQKARRSTTDSLTTKELQQVVQRMNLEKQYRELKKQEPKSIQKEWIDKYLDSERAHLASGPKGYKNTTTVRVLKQLNQQAKKKR